jgi:hypothetical protein
MLGALQRHPSVEARLGVSEQTRWLLSHPIAARISLKGRVQFHHGLSLQARVDERLRRMLNNLNPDLLDDVNARRR